MRHDLNCVRIKHIRFLLTLSPLLGISTDDINKNSELLIRYVQPYFILSCCAGIMDTVLQNTLKLRWRVDCIGISDTPSNNIN
jgi:hypothetical protein